MNSQYFHAVVFEDARPAAMVNTKKKGVEEVIIQFDIYKVGKVAKTVKRLEEFQIALLAHSPYSPDIPPCDFWFVGWIRTVIQNTKFHGPDHIRALTLDLRDNLDPSMLISLN
jgi:hypothetical protein